MASDDELLRALETPHLARDLLGVWVAVGEVADGLRLVTSPDLRHALRTSRSGQHQAWSNKSLACVLALGTRPRINPDVVPEFVLMNHVIGDDELIDDVRVLPEASVLTLHRRGSAETTYWTPEERMAPGSPTTARAIVEGLQDELSRVGQLPSVYLALTAGRDSRLLAACFKAVGGTAATFTMGQGTPDAIGARELCDQYGWSHVCLTGAAWNPSWAYALDGMVWTDGGQTVRDLLNDPLQWPYSADDCVVWGTNGELGRAIYWASQDAAHAQEAFIQRPSAMHLATHATTRWRDRCTAALATSTALAGGDPIRGLDVLYARSYMHKWVGRSLMGRSLGIYTPYSSPRLTRTLMDLPIDERRTSKAFDDALRLCGIEPPSGDGRGPAQPPPSRLRSAVRRRTGRRQPDLEQALRARGSAPDYINDQLGRRWWQHVRRHAGINNGFATRAWNALTVQAFFDLLEGCS
jgi:hypothetical protein